MKVDQGFLFLCMQQFFEGLGRMAYKESASWLLASVPTFSEVGSVKGKRIAQAMLIHTTRQAIQHSLTISCTHDGRFQIHSDTSESTKRDDRHSPSPGCLLRTPVTCRGAFRRSWPAQQHNFVSRTYRSPCAIQDLCLHPGFGAMQSLLHFAFPNDGNRNLIGDAHIF